MDVELTSRIALMLAIGVVASLYACGWMVWRRVTWGQVLVYEPRRRVPWGLGVGSLAIIMTAMNVLAALARPREAEPDAQSAAEFANGVMTMFLLYGGFSIAIVAVLLLVMGATIRDLGWPTSGRQFIGDVGLGVGLGLASLLPVYAIQYAAREILGIEPTHPFLEQMQADPKPLVFLAAALAAVVIAPIFEELVFRLLLQGGLERIEDDFIEGTYPRQPTDERLLDALSEPSHAHLVAPGAEHLQEYLPPEEVDQAMSRGRGAVIGLRRGWAPILASSFLFGLAHLGHGTSPIALFIFALFLGYAYQRTHRILPSIVAHLVLNSISILMMILILQPK
ncbi:MAG: CPBP family glutamic-type intramembrane protease [Aeoliella sp.]